MLSYGYTRRFELPILCRNGEEHERSMSGAWAGHEQNKSALRGMLHTPIYLAMTIATQICDTNRCVWT